MDPIGLGTFQLKGPECVQVVYNAMKVGYRRIDTSTCYKNEPEIAQAIQMAIEAQLISSRAELFLTTKVSPRQTGYHKAFKAIDESLLNLKTDYLDLVLLHWPGSSKINVDDPKNIELRLESIRAMKEALKLRKTKAIGVSNFEIRHLQSVEDAPISINQIEMHPLQYHYKLELIEYCKAKNILIEAYTSFGQGHLLTGKFPELDLVAKRNNCTRAQALLSWAIQKGFKTIPKASSTERLAENLSALNIKLSDSDIELIDSINERVGSKKYCWDQATIC